MASDKSKLYASPHLLLYQMFGPITDATTYDRKLAIESKRLKYEQKTGQKILDSIHWGQRKLLMSEIEFITNHYNDNEPITILYIGAAPGIHIVILASKLFPKCEFHLYDKVKFDNRLKKLDNVFLFEKYFELSMAADYTSKNVLMISDIRNLDIRKTKSDNLDIDKIIVQDMILQEQWYNTIEPKKALLKFRLPWTPGKSKYLDGDIYFQVWEGKSSNESRLVPNGNYKIYDNTTYEEQMFYFNHKTRREFYKHNVPCYGHCFDCWSEVTILQAYLKKFHNNNKHIEICRLGREITHSLSGKKQLFEKPPLDHFKI